MDTGIEGSEKTEKHIVEVYVFQDKLKYPIPFTQGDRCAAGGISIQRLGNPGGCYSIRICDKAVGKKVCNLEQQQIMLIILLSSMLMHRWLQRLAHRICSCSLARMKKCIYIQSADIS